ncbi:ankyrin repeat domain 54 [Plakobranchus ocellatus]|uniref:Ankyrin repeat domain 54 n=1 Tax=Plakobranchus ocellatus TaxID=259542 RepID=A0AAV4DZK1_9GAST|nr:ankyrin repeat domain 54 [Plakobranchus ocellatus]
MNTLSVSDIYISKQTEQRLVAAAGAGDISTVRKLLRKHVPTNILDTYGKSALHMASLAGHSEIVRILLEAGAQVNQTIGSKVTPLHAAARNHNTETIKRLVLGGAVLDAENQNGFTPINLCRHNTNAWEVLNDAGQGDMPEGIEEESEVPEIPDYALPDAASMLKGKKKNKSGSKKGKKVKGKKGKKSGGKKKGKMKKK